jgi:hypothetical protein
MKFELASSDGAIWDAFIFTNSQWVFALRYVQDPTPYQQDAMVEAITTYLLSSPVAMGGIR